LTDWIFIRQPIPTFFHGISSLKNYNHLKIKEKNKKLLARS